MSLISKIGLPATILGLSCFSASAETDFSKAFSLCIGDSCSSARADVNYSCSFAHLHAADAANLVCTIDNDFSTYSVVVVSYVGGGNCGEIMAKVRCRH